MELFFFVNFLTAGEGDTRFTGLWDNEGQRGAAFLCALLAVLTTPKATLFGSLHMGERSSHRPAGG